MDHLLLSPDIGFLFMPLSLCAVISICLSILFKRPNQLAAPSYSNDDRDFRKMLQDGYEKEGDQIFSIPTSNLPMYIVPPKFLNELHKLPEKTMSFRKEMYDRFLGRYTAFASNEDSMVKSVKVDLTRSIDLLLPAMMEESDYAIAESFNVSKDSWTEVPLHGVSTRLIAYLSGRSLVGLPLSRTPEWIDAAINVTLNAMAGSGKLWEYPSWSWPVVQYFLPETKGVREYFDKTAKMLAPLLKERKKQVAVPEFKAPADMTTWLVQHAKGDPWSLKYHTRQHIVLNIAAIHTTSGQLTNTLYELAKRPEYLEPLREEIRHHAGPSAIFTKQTLFQMKKLDSFLREVQRMNVPGLVSVNRKVLSPVTLSDGTALPKDISLAVAADAVARDSRIWGNNASEFDGFRFERLRKTPADDNRYQFTSINEESLSFGHGRSACPGRFFAAAELKVLVSKIIMQYDMKLSDGDPGQLHGYFEVVGGPDHTRKILFKRRATIS
ncbi:cytochrome p450 monooxygenase [Xylariaceae sp. FL0594]|nr:cytochrome p450 monooxygenase [Xylariaceae sp. FL0594]